MKRFLSVLLFALVGAVLFGQVNFSGNVYTGLRADITDGSSTVYANEDANGTPIWANFRMDYSLDKTAGLTLNFRTKGTDAISVTSARFYPFLNRGFVWGTALDGKVKARVGYLWDSDFETNGNAWDTASNYEWVSEFTFFPVKNVELGVTIPTPHLPTDLVGALQDITYGLVFSPDNFRFSMMGEYGSVPGNRDLNFGVDFTGIKGLILRVEGDLQQLGIDGVGYYQLYQQVNYHVGNLTPDFYVTEVLSKVSGVDPKITAVPNITAVVNGVTLFGSINYSFTTSSLDKATTILKASAQFPFNVKSWFQVGGYVTKGSTVTYSPFLQMFASF